MIFEMPKYLSSLLGASLATAALGQPLADNSFMLEEAYNQEDGIVQHIGLWSSGIAGSADGTWTYGFTQEWPAPSQKHQLGFGINLAESAADGDVEFGDTLLNYRYQWLSGPRLAVAPRLSLILSTGEPDHGTGSGATGLQVNLPVSTELGLRWVAHSNLGATWIPDAEDGAGATADTLAWNLGQSLIYRARPKLDLLFEAVWTRTDEVVAAGRTDEGGEGFLVAGVRWAHDFENGLQIVPGVAWATGFDDADGEDTLLIYLSFEHPFR
jgi:hypothetical protein